VVVVLCWISGVPPEMQHKIQQVYHLLLHKSTTHNLRLWVVVVDFFLLTAKGVPPFACANLRFANENKISFFFWPQVVSPQLQMQYNRCSIQHAACSISPADEQQDTTLWQHHIIQAAGLSLHTTSQVEVYHELCSRCIVCHNTTRKLFFYFAASKMQQYTTCVTAGVPPAVTQMLHFTGVPPVAYCGASGVPPDAPLVSQQVYHLLWHWTTTGVPPFVDLCSTYFFVTATFGCLCELKLANEKKIVEPQFTPN